MIIPKYATIAEEKIRDYLLKPPEEDDKSGYLALAGYAKEDYWELLRDIRMQILPGDAVVQRINEFGDFFDLVGVLKGPNGRSIGVRTIWVREFDGEDRFVTLFQD